MFKNYFKTAFRNIRKHKLQSLVNLLSLSIGITCCILIYVYVEHELSYEQFFENYEQIYRLEHKTGSDSQVNNRYANINQYANPGELNSIPGIVDKTRFATLPSVYLETTKKKISESDIWVSDSSFFSIFSFSFVKGNRSTALDQPNSIVLTKGMAHKYFGSTDVLGNTLTVIFQNASIEATVTGVIENIPSNSHLQFDGITSSSLYQGLFQRKLSQAYLGYTYLLLKKAQNVSKIEQQLAELSKKVNQRVIDFQLMPIADIHLKGKARGEISTNSDIRYIYFFSAIAIIILIVAGINFTSLSTAQALQRYKEAGIRKVLGSNKLNLITQFLFEAIFLSLIATAAGFLIIYLILPYFNTLTGISFTFAYFLNSTLILSILLGALIGLFAGAYPAMLLSAFQPVKTLKGISPTGKKGSSLWKSITVVQFTASIAMIICTVFIYNQLNYINTRNLGFEKERIVTTYNPVGPKYMLLKSRLKNLSGVKSVSMSSYIPGVSKTSGTAQILTNNRTDTLRFNWISVDFDYIDTYDIEIIGGRRFSRNYATDSTNAFMVNEAAVKALDLESPVGERIEAFSRKGTIIGVTRNFNFLSLYQDFTPIIFLIDKSLYFNFSIKLNGSADISETVAQIQYTWDKQLPNIPFKYDFVDEKFNTLYKADQRMGTFFAILTLLALFIACLGLFSLSSFQAANKRKEIGIRKVHGASISDILLSFYINFGKLITLASLIAVPISVYFVTTWLQNFAFKTDISIWVFLFAVGTALATAMATVSYESVKAAFSNPIESLRNE